MEDQANRPHRKSKEKKTASSGMLQSCRTRAIVLTTQVRIPKLLRLPRLESSGSRPQELTMCVQCQLARYRMAKTLLGQREKATCPSCGQASGGSPTPRRRGGRPARSKENISASQHRLTLSIGGQDNADKVPYQTLFQTSPVHSNRSSNPRYLQAQAPYLPGMPRRFPCQHD